MIERQLQAQIKRLAKLFSVVSVVGPRQSGKTTLVKSLFRNYAYVNLENIDTREAAIEDPRKLLLKYSHSGVIIDEAQKAPQLFSYLQQIVDESNQMGKYILTGSQNFLLLEKITQSLAGRVSIHQLLPFALQEIHSHKKVGKFTINEYLFHGMYPALFDRNIHPTDYYPNYLQTYIERDVRLIKNIANLELFRKFLQLCAGRIGRQLNLTSLGNEIGVDSKTARSWISVLEASFIIFLLPPFYKSFNKRITKQSKLYFYDTGVATSLLGLHDSSQIDNFYMRGELFENFVIVEYMKRNINYNKKANLYYWQESNGNEVDLIIEKNTKLIAVEIKSGTTLKSDFFKNLQRFQNIANTSPENCYLIYTGNNIDRKYAKALNWKNIDDLP